LADFKEKQEKEILDEASSGEGAKKVSSSKLHMLVGNWKGLLVLGERRKIMGTRVYYSPRTGEFSDAKAGTDMKTAMWPKVEKRAAATPALSKNKVGRNQPLQPLHRREVVPVDRKK